MTFPTGAVEIRKCSDEELKTMLDEAREASKHSRELGRVMGIDAAYRLQEIKDVLTFEKLANWRRMNGFDRAVDGEDNWFHGPRSLPPPPEGFTESLWCKVNELKRQPRCLLRLGLGRIHHNLLTDSNGNSRMRNLP